MVTYRARDWIIAILIIERRDHHTVEVDTPEMDINQSHFLAIDTETNERILVHQDNEGVGALERIWAHGLWDCFNGAHVRGVDPFVDAETWGGIYAILIIVTYVLEILLS